MKMYEILALAVAGVGVYLAYSSSQGQNGILQQLQQDLADLFGGSAGSAGTAGSSGSAGASGNNQQIDQYNPPSASNPSGDFTQSTWDNIDSIARSIGQSKPQILGAETAGGASAIIANSALASNLERFDTGQNNVNNPANQNYITPASASSSGTAYTIGSLTWKQSQALLQGAGKQMSG